MSADMVEPVIVLSDVSKRFVLHHDKSLKDRFVNIFRWKKNRDSFWALKDITLTIPLGTTVGLVGHNGSGKSTLLKVIGGIIESTSGTIRRRGKLAALLELGAGFHPDLTGRENVFLNASLLGLSRQQTEDAFDSIVEFSGVEQFIDTQVKFYSSGMYVRLAFAVAVHSDPDILLVDEVLAVGDEPFQEKCMNKIREFQREGRTIVLVSHSVDQVAEVCDRVVVLNAGEIIHDGDVETGVAVLRGTFEDARLSRLDSKQHEGGAAAAFVPAVSIEKVEVVVDGKSQPGMIQRDSTVCVRATLRVNRQGAWIAGFSIDTPLGQNVFRLNSAGVGQEMPEAPGLYVFDLEMKKFNLGGGQYVLVYGVETPTHERIDLNLHAGLLQVARDPRGAGYVQFAVSGGVALQSPETIAVRG